MDDKFHDCCAVMGVFGHPDAANMCYLGLYALQHRGQEGAGIVSTEGTQLFSHRELGLVVDAFDNESIQRLRGDIAIGHTRYGTTGGRSRENLQPFSASFGRDLLAVSHNGNLINAVELRDELASQGAIFSSTSDTEVILHLIARTDHGRPLVERVQQALERVRGAFSLAIMSQDRLLAVRDPYGVRPLALGKLADAFVVASESCAFDLLGAEFLREVEPGEIVEISRAGVETFKLGDTGKRTSCVFEEIYFSRPDSMLAGRSTYRLRHNLGAVLAEEHPVEADMVVPVPDSGTPAAMGYAFRSKLRFEMGLIRNHYVGRTFIEPRQSIRDFGVRIKLNPNREVVAGERIVLVDDSIVRGTTSKKIVGMLRAAGAKEIHLRVSSPPTLWPCHYGIDTPSREELIASTLSIEEIRNYIGADSLGYLSLEGMYRALDRSRENYCDACFSGEYQLGKPIEQEQLPLVGNL